MAHPVILVDGIVPPPLGASANGLKTATQVCTLSLQSLAGIQTMLWEVEGSSFVLSGGTTFPFTATLTLDGEGTYKITATANGNAAGDEATVASVYVKSPYGLRYPARNEQCEFNTQYQWHDAYAGLINGIGGVKFGHIPLANTATLTTASTGAPFGDIVTGNAFSTEVTPYVMAAPTGYIDGQVLVYAIRRECVVFGGLTWDAVFKLAGAWVDPAQNRQRTIMFFFSDPTWIEIGRSSADITY